MIDLITLTSLEKEAVRLSLWVAFWAILCSLPPGIFLAWILARKKFIGKALLDGLTHLPLVLPPVVTGLLTPDQGRITVNGNSVFDSQFGINVSPNRRRLGYVFQDGRLFPHLSVKSNLTYGMKLTNKNGQRVSFDKAVDVLDLGKLLCRRPAKLSGGEKQREAIGRALLTSPSVLLMDEPLSSLDEARKA